MANDYEYHPAVIGSDTTDLQSGTLTRVSQAFTRGVPAAAISGAMSIYNTFLDYGGKEQVSIEDTIRRFDDDMGDYYEENKSAVDLVGFVGTSLVPGTLGIKALQLARGGQAVGAVGRALSLTSSRKAYYLEKALQETAENAGLIKNVLSANRRKHLAWEVADNALLGAAAEIAVLGTMNDSPVFDKDSMGDFAWNTGLGITLSGLIGGPLASIGAKGILKSAQKEIQTASRQVDTVFSHENLGLTKGTEVLSFAESIAKLPDQFGDINFRYRVEGKQVETTLPVSGVLRAARDRATKSGQDQLALKFNELAEGNAVVGQAFFGFIKEASDAAKSLGRDPDEVISTIAGQLANVRRVSEIDLDSMALDARKFYVNTKPPQNVSDEEFLQALLSPKRTATTLKSPYRLAAGVSGKDIVVQNLDELPETSLKAAFRNNPSVDAVRLADGTLRINPKSSRVLRMSEDSTKMKMFIDLETGTHSVEAVPLFGDILQKGKHIVGEDYIATGRQWFKQVPSKEFSLATPAMEVSARWAWASSKEVKDILRITGGTIDSSDLPLLARLAELEGQLDEKLLQRFTILDNGVERSLEEIDGLKKFAESKRYELLEEGLQSWNPEKGSVPDVRALAAHLNTSRDWVEEAIDRGFRPAMDKEHAVGKILETKEALRPRVVQAEWDFSPVGKTMIPEEAYNMNMGPGHLITKELTRQYQIEIRRAINETAANAALGQDAEKFLDLNQLARDSSIEGAGSTTWGASNASYGERAKLAVQDTGKSVALVTQKRRDEVIGTLTPHINALKQDSRAAAELGILTTALRKSPFRFVFAEAEAGSDIRRIVSTEVMDFAAKQKIGIKEALEEFKRLRPSEIHTHEIQHSTVADFLEASTAINNARNDKFTPLYNAAGLVRKNPGLGAIYVPPINTVKYPYHAFVRTKEKVGVASDISMITAKDENQLRMLAAKVDTNEYDVIFKKDTELYHKARGEYDYSSTLNESRVNSDLARKGVLADFYPETRLENTMTDWLEWHAKQEEKLVRTAVEVKNRQFFSEMRFLSDNYRIESESVARGIGSKFKKGIADPFDDYIKTALNISKQQEIPLLDSLNDFVDKIGMKAGDALEKAFRDSEKGLLNWEDASKIAERYGLGLPYRDVDTYIAANERFPRNLIREGFQKANMFLATATLRLDFANSLLNIISTPIMLGTEMQSIRGLVAKDSALAGKLRELTQIKVPGQEAAVPSTTKLTANAISNFFGAEKQNLMQRYRDIGSIKEVSQLYHEVLDDLSFNPILGGKQWTEKVNKAVEKGAKITGNTFAEDFTRFVSADVMRQLSDPLVAAGKLSVKEQNAYISSFVNRVQGNYVTSQRPIVFQGTTGAAISLFQTYAFNVLQQLHRHIEAGDKKTLMVFGGLQSSVFGFNGLPFFDAVNTHLIGSLIANNSEHKDAYNTLPAFNKELGDWLLYGTASAMPLFSGSWPALYTRGDINPRHLTVVPVTPLDVPAVNASLKLVSTLKDFGKNLVDGMDLSDAMLKGMEHQGLNRPLAGFAQLLAGESTTSKGSLISAANELQTTSWLGAISERMGNFGGAARLMGAKPMDEAVALNHMYRNKTYEAMDKARIERLGQIVKSKLANNESPSVEEMEDFMLRYARSGGRIENFSAFIQRASRDANVSIVNQTMAKIGSPYGRKLQEIMGGEQLPDYRSQAATEPEE